MASSTITTPTIAAGSKQYCRPLISRFKATELGNEEFDPQIHLSFKRPSKVHTMKDLGLPEDTGISSVAVSEPFSLFTEEAVHRMRVEVLSEEVMANCQYSSDLAQCQLRGFAAKYAPFVYDTWKHPATLAIISEVAGIDLVTAMDFEIGTVNISVKSEERKQEELAAIAERTSFEEDEGIAGCPWEDDKPIVDWHRDSYPFVCVTMLSDCSQMVGGETALKTGNGDILKLRGPQMGCAVVLQGRYIEHQALRALGSAERITMVTSFRPRSPKVPDDTVLTTVRPVSDLSQLYYEYSEYRLEILEERIRSQLKALREAKNGAKRFSTAHLKAFLREQTEFLEHMNDEMVIEAGVKSGVIKPTEVAEAVAKKPRKRAREV